MTTFEVVRRVVWCLIAFAPLWSCTIDRVIPIERFACEKGGPCENDGGTNNRDADLPDAIDPDAQIDDGVDTGVDGGVTPMDGALPHESCSSAVPIDPRGFESGLLEVEENTHNAVCNTMVGGLDKVMYFYTPGRLARFFASTERSAGLDTVLYLYKNECQFGTEIACNNDVDEFGGIVTSQIEAFNLAAGAYYLVLDGLNATTRGAYALDVSGTIAPDEPCDPALEFLSCDQSYCDVRETPPICTRPKDCDDDLNNDFDAETDEDTCVFPPRVTCPADVTIGVDATVSLNGMAADDNGTLIGTRWELISAPVNPFPFRFVSNARTAPITLPLVGQYVLRYSAADDELQAFACETKINATTNIPLRIELLSVARSGSDLIDLDLHMLHPMAPAWFNLDYDCYIDTCTEQGLPWDGVNHLGDSIGSPGLEIIQVTNPTRGGIGYEVGGHYYDSAGGMISDVWALIHCDNGAGGQTFGPKMLSRGDIDNPGATDFWKVAQVIMQPGMGCTVNARDQVITQLQAEAGR